MGGGAQVHGALVSLLLRLVQRLAHSAASQLRAGVAALPPLVRGQLQVGCRL